MASSRKTIAGAAAALAAALVALAAPGGAPAAAPAPCAGVVQVSDATGDGHHNTTDILSAWLSESAGRLQAAIKVRSGNWAPDHPDSDGAGFALLFNAGGQTWYVRAVAPPPGGPIAYDYGTWTSTGGFASSGPTVGEVVYGAGGTVTIDVPAATGAAPGTVLTGLFALTYDGLDGPGQIHWVDRGPGGVVPAGTEFGADYVVGACGAGTGGAIVAVDLKAPEKRTGAGAVTVRGGVVPATAGVPVELEVRTRGGVETKRVTTDSAGRFSTPVKLGETTRIRALAAGLGSQTEAVTVRSRTKISVRPSPGDDILVRGRTDPRLPGKALLLRSGAATPSARVKVRDGRFSFDLERLEPGRYAVVYIPSRNRAERSTSNQERVK